MKKTILLFTLSTKLISYSSRKLHSTLYHPTGVWTFKNTSETVKYESYDEQMMAPITSEQNICFRKTSSRHLAVKFTYSTRRLRHLTIIQPATTAHNFTSSHMPFSMTKPQWLIRQVREVDKFVLDFKDLEQIKCTLVS